MIRPLVGTCCSGIKPNQRQREFGSPLIRLPSIIGSNRIFPKHVTWTDAPVLEKRAMPRHISSSCHAGIVTSILHATQLSLTAEILIYCACEGLV